MIFNTLINTLDLLEIYLTPLPYDIYNEANNAGNMAYAGIGLGLIHAQKKFWITNGGSFLFFYFNSNNYLFAVILVYFYYYNISKTFTLLRLLTNHSCN